MSVGHVARAVEIAGIPTVSIFVKAFEPRAALMGVPRTIVPRHPMGRPLGAAGDVDRQTAVVEAAFTLLETATEGGAILELEHRFRPGTVA